MSFHYGLPPQNYTRFYDSSSPHSSGEYVRYAPSEFEYDSPLTGHRRKTSHTPVTSRVGGWKSELTLSDLSEVSTDLPSTAMLAGTKRKADNAFVLEKKLPRTLTPAAISSRSIEDKSGALMRSFQPSGRPLSQKQDGLCKSHARFNTLSEDRSKGERSLLLYALAPGLQPRTAMPSSTVIEQPTKAGKRLDAGKSRHSRKPSSVSEVNRFNAETYASADLTSNRGQQSRSPSYSEIPVTMVYKCRFCDGTFSRASNARSHVEDEHRNYLKRHPEIHRFDDLIEHMSLSTES